MTAPGEVALDGITGARDRDSMSPPPIQFSLGEILLVTMLVAVYVALAVALGGPPLRLLVLAIPFLFVVAGRWLSAPALLTALAVVSAFLWLVLPQVQ